MSINDLVALAGQHPGVILLLLGPLPVLAWLVGRFAAGAGASVPWKYCYSVLVYLACVPGIMAAVLTGYGMFFINQNLLQVNLMVYGLPILVMILTLFVIGRQVEYSDIPGFDRLGGLMVILAISFAVALFMVKARIWLLFGSSLATLFAIAIAAFFLLRWGSARLFR